VVPSHEAWLAPTGLLHAMHADPHEFALVFATHTLEQGCAPMSQVPTHGWPFGRQAPLQRVIEASAHLPPHIPCVQVAVPFVIIVHGVQEDGPQLAGSVSSTHLPLQLWNPVLQATWQMPPTQAAAPFGSVGQAVQAAPQAVASSSFAQLSPQTWVPPMQVKPHLSPSHVAAIAYSGVGQGLHAAPQAFTSNLLGQSAPHAWVPSGHVAGQVAAMSTQAPWQAFLPLGQVMSQAPSTQAAAPPPFGVAQGAQETPHVAGLVSSKQPPGHMCCCAAHAGTAGPSGARSGARSAGASPPPPLSDRPSAEPSCGA
jgi:hypothetical protein